MVTEFDSSTNAPSTPTRPATGSGGLFGSGYTSPRTPQPTSSFGQTLRRSSSTGLFGGAFPVNSSTSAGLFGRSTPTSSPGLFGGSTQSSIQHTQVVRATSPGARNYAMAVAPDVRVTTEHAFELGSEVVTFVVGSDGARKSFIVHKAVIANRAPKLLGTLESGAQSTIALPDVEPQVFSLYLQYLYTRRLPSKPNNAQPTVSEHTAEITLLCRLFVLSKSVGDDQAAKDATNAIYAKAHEVPPNNLHVMLPSSVGVDMIYKVTDRPCGTRTLLVDLYIWKAASKWVKDHLGEDPAYPPEFLSDLAVALLEQREDRSKVARMEKKVSEYYD